MYPVKEKKKNSEYMIGKNHSFVTDIFIPHTPSSHFALQRLSALHPLIPVYKIWEVYRHALSYDESIPRMSERKWIEENILVLQIKDPSIRLYLRVCQPVIHFLRGRVYTSLVLMG